MRLCSEIRTADTADGTDIALLNAMARGDMYAFERLYHRFCRPVHGFALRLTGDAQAAEEVMNDTLHAAWRGADKFKGFSRPSTWIFGIAYRLALKARRRRPREAAEEDIEAFPAAQTGTEQIEHLFERRQIARALTALPAEQRAVVTLTYYHGYLYTEIAEILDCPEATVKTRMRAARLKLRTLLNPSTEQRGSSHA